MCWSEAEGIICTGSMSATVLKSQVSKLDSLEKSDDKIASMLSGSMVSIPLVPRRLCSKVVPDSFTTSTNMLNTRSSRAL